ncbi:MAG: hypothetical protein M1292_00695 [Bacteroidetes bacterium]|nr:hypothetical protein [Bacteroidota bacterium]
MSKNDELKAISEQLRKSGAKDFQHKAEQKMNTKYGKGWRDRKEVITQSK